MDDRAARAVSRTRPTRRRAGAAKPLTPTRAARDAARGARRPGSAGTPFWIFAYGSLMWNPELRVGRAPRGHHARLPPLVPRLVAHQPRHARESRPRAHARVRRQLPRASSTASPPDRVQEEMQRIWKREMTYGSYRPKWLNCVVGDETIRALVFTVNRACSGYAGRIPEDVMVRGDRERRAAATARRTTTSSRPPRRCASTASATRACAAGFVALVKARIAANSAQTA